MSERENISANAIPLRRNAEGEAVSLSSADAYLLERVDGFSSIEELALMVGIHVRDAVSALLRLQDAGVVSFADHDAGPQREEQSVDDQQDDSGELEVGSTDVRLKPGVADDEERAVRPWWSSASSAAAGESEPWEGSYAGKIPLPVESTTRATPRATAQGSGARKLKRTADVPTVASGAASKLSLKREAPKQVDAATSQEGASVPSTPPPPLPKTSPTAARTPPPPAPRTLGRSAGAKTPAVDQRSRALSDTGELTSKTLRSSARSRGEEDDTDRIETVANYGRDKEDTQPHPTPPESSFRAAPAQGSSPTALPASGTSRYIPREDEVDTEPATAQISRPVAGRPDTETRPQDPVHDGVTAPHDPADADETGPQRVAHPDQSAVIPADNDRRFGQPSGDDELPEADEVLASLDLSSRATEIVDPEEFEGEEEKDTRETDALEHKRPWADATIDEDVRRENAQLQGHELRMLSWYLNRVRSGTYYSLLDLDPNADDSTVAAAATDARRYLLKLRETGRCSVRGDKDIELVLGGVQRAEKVLGERESRRRYDNALKALHELKG